MKEIRSDKPDIIYKKGKPVVKWTASSIYVDLDTGQTIRKDRATNPDIWHIIKTIKKTYYNERNATGKIEYTIECRRNPQGKLFNN